MANLMFLESVVNMPLMELPVRSVVAPLNQGVVLISPGSKLSETQLAAAGGVTDIVAPNLFHCAGIALATQVFPKAKVWGPVGAKELKSDQRWDAELETGPWPYQTELQMINLRGAPKIGESLFLHVESRSLIIADFVFNIIDAQGLGAWLILNLFGTYQKLGVSRLYARSVQDMDAFRESISQVMALDFENLIVSHGRNVIGQAKPRLEEALIRRGLL